MKDTTMDRMKKNSVSGEWKDILKFLDVNSEDYYFFLDIDKEMVCFSEKMRSKVGFVKSPEMICLLSEWEKNVYVQDRQQFWEEWEAVRSGSKKEHNLEYRVVNWGGEVVWVNSSGKVETDSQGHPSWIFGRISENKLQNRADKFSGAFSMDGFKEELSKILLEQKGGYLLLVGVDGLKSINMKKGWEFGDEILKLIVRYLEEITGAKRVYRVNGDCFAVNIMKESEQEVSEMFSRLQKYLTGKCTLSGGCVPLLKYTVPDVETLFQYAENSLDNAKAKGKNLLSFFSAEDYEKNMDELELKEELAKSVKNGFEGFRLYYQPQMYTDSLILYGAEALLRYWSVNKGMISPVRFIPVLEETGLIHSVGIWILETALEQCKRWRNSAPDFHISVNMSCCQLLKPEIADIVVDCVKKSGLPSGCLTIEITESMSLSADCQVNNIFSRWKREGIRISMDDFGTGYSSLSRLSKLDVDEIKIDQCFVHEIQKSVYNHHLIGNMIELAENRNIDVCCEGVETISELAALKELGPRFLQGYLFAQPCSPEQFELMYFGEIAHDFRKRLDRINRSVFQQMPVSRTSVEWLDEEIEKNILDNLNDVIYVSDMDTYEIYYLNKAGKKALDVKDYTGKKCYKVLQGKEEPCEFCTNHLLNEKSFYVWERENDYCGRRYYLKDKQINSNGKKLRLEIAVDVTKLENFSEETKECLKFADKLQDCARALVVEEEPEQAADRILQTMCGYCKADRAFIVEWNDQDGWFPVHEWNQGEQEVSGQVPVSKVMSLMEKRSEDLQKNRVVVCSAQGEDEPNTADREEKNRTPEVVIVPVLKKGKMAAALYMERPELCPDYDSHLRTFANLLSNVVCSGKKSGVLSLPDQRTGKNILDLLNVGMWMIRYRGDVKELFVDDTMLYVMGGTDASDPQVNYRYWYNRVCNGYYQYVDDCLNRMVDSWEIVQLEYTWNHPKKGEVVVRCTGVRIPEQDGNICLKGYHRIVSGIDWRSGLETDSRKIVFEYNETSKTAFFHCGNELVEGGVTKETDFPQCWVDRGIVHPKYTWKFYKHFSLLRMKEHFEELEIPLKLSDGDYEWYVISLRHLSKAEKDLDTVIVTIEPFGEYRRLQLEHQRLQLFYQAVLSETIAHAEVELESGELKSLGGIWEDYEKEFRRYSGCFVDFMLEKLGAYLKEEDLQWVKEYKSLQNADGTYFTDNQCRRFEYQREVDGKLIWVQLVCHLFREDSTQDIYILLYLKDINDQKQREIKQIKAATEDNLTHVLNHTAFEKKVTKYVMSDPNPVSGAFILFDVDNFKQINDLKGHLAGDLALKRFAAMLNESFSQRAVIGRLGGDEFMVFAMGAQRKEDVEETIRCILADAKKNIGLETSCSVGIAFVNRENFNYSEYLHKADLALYNTKRRGKDGFSYYNKDMDVPAQE